MNAYTHPVSQLLTRGKPEPTMNWSSYLSLGISEKDIPELNRLATDRELLNDPSDNPEIWAPYHAWRILGHLKATEAIEPLINLLNDLEEDDWALCELPRTFGLIGQDAIPGLAALLLEKSNQESARFIAADSFKEIALRNPSEKEKCISILSKYLDSASLEESTLNGIVVANLLDLDAKNAIDSIRSVFHRDIIDLGIAGNLDEVEFELGLRDNRGEELPFHSLRSRRIDTKEAKVGRNEPCPCGSGKKYKKCCIK